MTASLGLTTGKAADRIALRGVRVRTTLLAMSEQTTVEQTFVNQEERTVEPVYTFPLPDGAAVTGFEVHTGDRVLTGEVEELETAIDRYDAAVGLGDAAYLLEQERPDVFTARIGSLKPGQAATIRIVYVRRVDLVDGSIRVAFPTTLAPRYVTDAGTDPLAAWVDGDALNPPHVLTVPYGLSMEVDIALGCPVRSVESPSHSIQAEGVNSDRASVRLTDDLVAMDRDVVLHIAVGEPEKPSAQVADGGSGADTFVAVGFLPDFAGMETHEAAGPSEIVFLLDCSGSMDGRSIEQAKSALELCLRSLEEGTRFNICRFGSTYELFSEEPVPYSERTLGRALRWLRSVDADLGGTELDEPLRKILSHRPAEGRRDVVLLTDGQVTNEPALIDEARRHREGHRIFTFGIGPACSKHLVHGLARSTGGAAELITYGERIEDKVLRTFSRIASPAIRDVRMDWEGAAVEQAPAELTALYDGDATVVFGRVSGTRPERVTLSCRTDRGCWQWTIPLSEASSADPTTLARLWARGAIEDHDADPSGCAERAVELSKVFGVLCSRTAFVAVEHRSPEEREEGRPALRQVPLLLPEGWGGVEKPAASAAPAGPPRLLSAECLSAPLSEASAAPVDSHASEADERDTLLCELLKLQRADGSFEDGEVIPAAISELGWTEHRCRDLVRNEAAKLPANRLRKKPRATVEVTVLVLWLLHAVAPARRRLWKRAQHKGVRYLCRTTGRSADHIENHVAKLPTARGAQKDASNHSARVRDPKLFVVFSDFRQGFPGGLPEGQWTSAKDAIPSDVALFYDTGGSRAIVGVGTVATSARPGIPGDWTSSEKGYFARYGNLEKLKTPVDLKELRAEFPTWRRWKVVHRARVNWVPEEHAEKLASIIAESNENATAALRRWLPNQYEETAMTPTTHGTIHEAAWANDVDDVRRHLSHGADVNECDANGCSALHYAGGADVAEVLIERGAVIDAADQEGMTPLHWFVYLGMRSTVGVLVRAGADVDAQDIDGTTPRMSAMAGLYLLAEVLVESESP